MIRVAHWLQVALPNSNPFLLRWLRRASRQADLTIGWAALVGCGGCLVAWEKLTAWDESAWLIHGRWHACCFVVFTVSVIACARSCAAVRDLLADEGNRQELLITRLTAREQAAAWAVAPLAVGLRSGLVCVPALVWLACQPGPPPPSPLGVAMILAVLLLFTCFLALASSAAAALSRGASSADWSDFLFNARTLFALILNPFWIVLAVLSVSFRGLAWADWLVTWHTWFGITLPGWLWFVPLTCWVMRQVSGLATHLAGESAELSRQVVRWQSAAYLTGALLATGFGWQTRLVDHRLALWWELPPTAASSAYLLGLLLAWSAYPLLVAASYAAMLRCGLRSADHAGDEGVPAPRAVARQVGSAVAAASLVPLLVWLLATACGGWPATVMAVSAGRLLALWATASVLTASYLALLVTATRLDRAASEQVSAVTLLAFIAAPLALLAPGELGQWLAASSPFTALLAMAPEIGSGTGLTGEIPLRLDWPQVAAGQALAGVAATAVAGWLLVKLRAGHQPSQSRRDRDPFVRVGNPLLALELRVLRRTGGLLAPVVLLALPLLALAAPGLSSDLAWMLAVTAGRAAWPGHPTGASAQQTSFVLFCGTAVGIVLLHVVMLGHYRSFARDVAAGRLDSARITIDAAATLVPGRYLANLSVFALLTVLLLPTTLYLGWRTGDPLLGLATALHLAVLTVALPAWLLAEGIGQPARGVAAGGWLLLEAGRMALAGALAPRLGASLAALAAAGCLALLALPATWWAVRGAVASLARRGGETD